MHIELSNNRTITVRPPEEADTEKLFHYFQELSEETKSRFGPHPFDRDTIYYLCSARADDILPWIGIDNASGQVIAYMVVKKGMLEGDQHRYDGQHFFADNSTTVTFAPSVADAWQGAGLGKLMNRFIEGELRKRGVKFVVLWGGVQEGNERAIRFYQGEGYIPAGSFWHHHRNNYDMIKFL